MEKETWSQKLKRELREAKAELAVAKEDLSNRDGLVSKRTSILLSLAMFLGGMIVNAILF